MVFHWSLRDSKFPLVSRTLLGILADLDNAGDCLVSLALFFPSRPVPLPILWGLFQVHQLQLVSPSSSCSIAFLFSSKVQIFIPLFAFFYLLLFAHMSFFTSALADGFFYRSLSDSKSPHVSRTFLGMLVDLNYAVVWMVSTRPVISKSSSPCINSLVTVPRTIITIGIIVTFMFHSFFKFLSSIEVLIPLFAFFQLYSEQIHNSASSLFFVDYY